MQFLYKPKRMPLPKGGKRQRHEGKKQLEVCMKKLLPKLGLGPSLITTTHIKRSYKFT
jgi:hypothetical protein